MEKQMPKELSEVFKYVSFDVGETIISNFSLKFSKPQDFNDPLDCDIAGLFFDLNGKIDPIVKREIAQMKNEFPLLKLTNDQLAETYEKIVTERLNQSIVTCFSKDKNNHVMWAHYARNHTGMCLGFDNTVNRAEKFIDIEIGIEGEMNYGYEEKVNYCEDKITGNQRLYFTKLKPWTYESEFRYVAVGDEGIYHFPKKSLKEIILGLRVTPQQIDRIIRLCERRKLENVKILVTEISGSNLVYKNIR